jgi:hypothetical protein
MLFGTMSTPSGLLLHRCYWLLWSLNFGSSANVISGSKVNMLTALFLPVVGN